MIYGMNIKINLEQRNKLWNRRLNNGTIFGSRLYGTFNSESDTDILYFYKDFTNNFGVPYRHCFQYDSELTQELWVGQEQFWYLLQAGDSTIFAEYILFSSSFDNLEKIQICKTYNILKCFLGYVKRDLKFGTEKRIKHAIRSMFIVDKLLNNELPTLDFTYLQKTNLNLPIDKQLELYQALRDKLNNKFQNDEIKMFYIPKTDDELHRLLLNSNNIKEFNYIS